MTSSFCDVALMMNAMPTLLFAYVYINHKKNAQKDSNETPNQ